MIIVQEDIGGPALGVEFSGQVGAADFDEVLVPAVRRAREANASLRLLLHYTPAFRRFTTTAAWEDPHIGLQHLDDYERVAIVTDLAWLSRLAGELAAARPDAVRHFPHAERAAAAAWVASR